MAIYKIVNLTKNQIIADNVNIAQSFFQKTKGLIGRTKLNKGEGLYISGCRSIHMFFMQFSIDVIFIDKNYEITKIITDLKPFRLAFGTYFSNGVIELPCGILEQKSCDIGDKIVFIKSNF